MGFRYIGLGKEATYGSAVAASRYLEAIASIKPDQNWVIPPPIASRAFRKRNLGPYRARGNIGDFPVEPENIGELLLGVFGTVASVQQGSTAAYLHTFSPADTLPSYTVKIGVEQTQRVLPGGLIEALTVKFPHNGDITANAEVLSGFVESKASVVGPTISPLHALNMQDADSILTIADLNRRTLAYDLELTIKNNIPFDKGNLAGRYFEPKRFGQREVSGKLSTYFDDTTEYDRFIAGTEFTLVIVAQGPEFVTGYYYTLKFELRRCAYSGGVPDVKPQNEPLVIDAPFKALYDTTGGFNAEAKATLRNTITSY